MAKAVHVMLDGEKWAVVREGNKRPTSRHDTQKEAWTAAVALAKKDKTKAVKMGKDGTVKEQRDFCK
ncbi:MAG: DUF2188 domain-containing protein [Armatimonadota bacterium]